MDTRLPNPNLPPPSIILDEHGCLIHNDFELLREEHGEVELLVEHVTIEVPEPMQGANDAEPEAEIRELAG